jgi:hypothetical protein
MPTIDQIERSLLLSTEFRVPATIDIDCPLPSEEQNFIRLLTKQELIWMRRSVLRIHLAAAPGIDVGILEMDTMIEAVGPLTGEAMLKRAVDERIFGDGLRDEVIKLVQVKTPK